MHVESYHSFGGNHLYIIIAGAANYHNYPKAIIKVPNNAISYLFPAKYLIHAPKQFKNELI